MDADLYNVICHGCSMTISFSKISIEEKPIEVDYMGVDSMEDDEMEVDDGPMNIDTDMDFTEEPMDMDHIHGYWQMNISNVQWSINMDFQNPMVYHF
jgi:hypothetical protein